MAGSMGGMPTGAMTGGGGGRNMPQMRIKLLQQLMDMGFKVCILLRLASLVEFFRHLFG